MRLFLMTSCWDFCAERPNSWDIRPPRGRYTGFCGSTSKAALKIGRAHCGRPDWAGRQADVGAELSRNEYYWNGEVPYDTVSILFIEDSSTKAMAL